MFLGCMQLPVVSLTCSYWCLIFLYSFTNYHLWATYVNFITLTYSYLSEKICPIAVCSWILLHWCYNHFLPITTMFFCVFFICFMFLTQSKVIYTKYSKHQPYIVAHTIDCVYLLKYWIMVWAMGYFFHFSSLYPVTRVHSRTKKGRKDGDSSYAM